MSDIKLNINIDKRDFERKLILAIQKKMRKFLDIFAGKIDNFIQEINDLIAASDVTRFIQGQGAGQLGIIDADGLLNELYSEMDNSSEYPSVSSPTGGTMKFSIGNKEALRAATLFTWSNKKGLPIDVDLFTLIEDGNIGDAWRGFGNPEHSFKPLSRLSPAERRLSRTGKGIMVQVGPGDKPYSLPAKYQGGFSRAVLKSRGSVLKKILLRLMNEAAREAGFRKTVG